MKTNNVKVYRTTSEFTGTKILIGINIEINRTDLTNENHQDISNELEKKAGDAAIGIFCSTCVNEGIVDLGTKSETKVTDDDKKEKPIENPKPQPVHKEKQSVQEKPQAVKMTDDIIDPEPENEPETKPEAKQTNEEPIQENNNADDDEW